MTPTTSRIIAQSQGPSDLSGVPSRRTTFFVNRQYASEHSIGGTYSGQMYVELHEPVQAVAPHAQKNIVLLHGDFFTGKTWLAKADGSPSWAAHFLGKGYNVFVIDLPGVGNSSFLDENDYQVPGVPRTVRRLTADLVEQEFTASEQFPLPDGSSAWSTANGHNQWPGTGRRGDPIFDSLMESTTDMVLSKVQHEELGTIAVTDLLKQIGPSFLLGHGTGATIGMLTADAVPRLVRGIISIEPDGPPCAQPGRPVGGRMTYTPYLQYDPNIRRYGISDAPPTFSPALQSAPGTHPLKIQVRQHPKNNGCYMAQQKVKNILIYNIHAKAGQEAVPQMIHLAGVPHALYTSQSSPHSLYDWATVCFLRQAGVIVDWYLLPASGVEGNGHLMHQEENSDVIVKSIDEWTAGPVEEEDRNREKRIQVQKELEERFHRPSPLTNGLRDEPYELEFVVQPDAVAHQPSPALSDTPPTVDPVDTAGPVITIDPAGPVTTVDAPTDSFAQASPALPASGLLSEDLSIEFGLSASEAILQDIEQVAADREATLASLSDEAWQWPSFDEIEEQAERPLGDFDPNQAPNQAQGLYPSPIDSSSAENVFFDTADTDMEMLPEWTPDLCQHENIGLPTAGIPEIEDLFQGEWTQFLNEDLVRENFVL